MKRREFMKAGIATLATSAFIPASEALAGVPSGSQASQEKSIVIENGFYRVEVDSERGLIIRLLDKKSGVDLITVPHLADNFTLLLPLPDLEANYIYGKEQQLTSCERNANGLTLAWKGPLKNPQGPFDLDVFLRITFEDECIQFTLDVQNKTQYQVAEAWYPILGGITGIGDRKDSREMIPSAGRSTATDLFRDFPGTYTGGGLGISHVETFWSYPSPMPMPWISLYNQKLKRGMYFACHDTISRFKTVRFELHPGIGSRQYGGNWPRAEEVDPEFPVGMKLHWAHYPYIREGETFQGPPVVLQFHDGDWHHAAKIYRRWFKSHFTILDHSESWMRRELAFSDTSVLLPEGNINLKFKHLSQWAKATLDNGGVKSVLVSGWNVGGHDGNYPYYEPDPRLGTWDDLAAGIQECHKVGVKVYFFTNVQPVRVDTDWYQKELHRYVSMDKWGVPYAVTGWGMGTLSARLDFTRPPIASACSGIPAFRKIIVDQMVKLAQIGADGIHIDKLWPSPGLDFNPLSTLGPDQATSQGKLLAVEEILRACKAVNANFAISNESAWDRTLTYSTVAWAWQDNTKDHVPVLKYTFPEWLPGLFVPQPYDYTPVNNAVRYGYQIFVFPGNGIVPESMGYKPMRQLSAYIKEMLRILEGLKDTIHFGDFLYDLGVKFEGPQDTRYSVFQNPKTGKRACIVVNLGEGAREAVVRGFDGNDNGIVQLHRPFAEPRDARLPVQLTIPSERLVIVVEG